MRASIKAADIGRDFLPAVVDLQKKEQRECAAPGGRIKVFEFRVDAKY